jgi:hypothetical protein
MVCRAYVLAYIIQLNTTIFCGLLRVQLLDSLGNGKMPFTLLERATQWKTKALDN